MLSQMHLIEAVILARRERGHLLPHRHRQRVRGLTTPIPMREGRHAALTEGRQ